MQQVVAVGDLHAKDKSVSIDLYSSMDICYLPGTQIWDAERDWGLSSTCYSSKYKKTPNVLLLGDFGCIMSAHAALGKRAEDVGDSYAASFILSVQGNVSREPDGSYESTSIFKVVNKFLALWGSNIAGEKQDPPKWRKSVFASRLINLLRKALNK